MYKVTWDRNLNGILLIDNKSNSKIIIPPRPVFFEELDLLGFNKFWKYPKSQEPLLWAIGRRYYYKGELVAEAKGGNIFEHTEIMLTEKGQNLKLEPIDIKEVIEKNKEALFVLENEALDFIEHVYQVYKKKEYLFAVSFSGGKDSQVVLDLVTRVIPPDDLVVIFSDTTIEISYTYKNVEKTKEEYEKRYPGLKFYIAKPLKPAIEFWKEFGPPSRIHRWCCTVIKTAPFVNKMKEVLGEDFTKVIVVFDGVRSDESVSRSKYLRLSSGKKHTFQINAEVIRGWNATEVFLYLLYRGLFLNRGYRYGLSRVGCSVCPFNSSWSETVIRSIEGEILEPYINELRSLAKTIGVDNSQVYSYIAEGQWKKRAGGEGVAGIESHLELIIKDGDMTGIMTKPSEDFLEWSKTVGDVIYKGDKNKFYGDIRIREKVYPFDVEDFKDKKIVHISFHGDKTLESKLKNVLYKSTYCIHCGACEAECPTNALKVIPKVSINSNKCTHCGNCLGISERGCLVAKSLQIAEGGRNMKKDSKLKGFGRYLTFGMREIWLIDFMTKLENWFENNDLGNKQLESMKAWLVDTELIDKNKQPTPLVYLLSKFYSKYKKFVWEIIWINLYYGSSPCKIYIDNIEWNSILKIDELEDMIQNIDSSLSPRTVKSGINSLVNTFDNSPLGSELKIGIIEKRSRERYIKKVGTDDIQPLSVAYSLYKAAEHTGRRDFTVSELYSKEFKGGPYKLFGISRDKLERILRGLQEDMEQILRVDLVADLDNIYLRNDLSPLDVLKIAEARLK